MAELVRARIGDVEKNVGAAFAKVYDLETLDEPTARPDGSPRATTRKDGRRAKNKTTVDQSATAKKAATKPASTAEEATE